MKIQRGSAKFHLGISFQKQIDSWLTENPNALGVAFIGRSNVGKSSLINALFGAKTARVSNTPGRTQEINIFTFEIEKHEGLVKYHLFDLPGYGHAKVSKGMSKNWNTIMNTFFSKISPNVLMINIQDARHPNQKSDQEFHTYIKNFDFNTFLIFNKMDKLKNQKEKQGLRNQMPKLYEEYKWVKQIHQTSAEKKTGVEELESAILNYISIKEVEVGQIESSINPSES